MTGAPCRSVLGAPIHATNYEHVCSYISKRSTFGESGYICVANVHMVMEAFDSPEFRSVMKGADLVTPDGMPLVWALRLLGVRNQERVYGPDLTLEVCGMAAHQGIPVAFYGGTPESLQRFSNRVMELYPKLNIVCQIAPPFRVPTSDEDEEYTRSIVDSGARIVLVGIGCPKQEQWMAAHKDRIPAVMLGVGAAFDFHSGRVKQAPAWMQQIGMEWFFRLLMEPRRLWKRYLKHNPRFIFLFLMQLLGLRRFQED